jgi:hypothetical protein
MIAMQSLLSTLRFKREPHKLCTVQASAPRKATNIQISIFREKSGAGYKIRTRDILITNQALYQLS